MFTPELIFNNFWLLFILVSTFNAFYLRLRASQVTRTRPELREGYEQLFWGELVFLNLPWLVAGAGMLFGGVPDFFSFLRPRTGQPFVVAFYITILVLWALTIWWIYFKGGAEFLVSHPGGVRVFRQDIRSPLLVKLLVGLMLAGSAAALISMWIL